MISICGAAFLLIAFALLARHFGLVHKTVQAVKTAQSAFQDLKNPQLDDDAKEKVLQQHARDLFALALWLCIGTLAALGIPVGAILVLDFLDLISFDLIMKVAVSIEFIIFSVLAIFLFYLIKKKCTK